MVPLLLFIVPFGERLLIHPSRDPSRSQSKDAGYDAQIHRSKPLIL
jgi:hypothetical protein